MLRADRKMPRVLLVCNVSAVVMVAAPVEVVVSVFYGFCNGPVSTSSKHLVSG